MRAVIQRVLSARCTVDGRVTGEIGRGLLVFVGVGKNDTERDLMKCADKIANIRIFEDEKGKCPKAPRMWEARCFLYRISRFTAR